MDSGRKGVKGEVSLVTCAPEPESFFHPLGAANFSEYEEKVRRLERLKKELLGLIAESDRFMREYVRCHARCRPLISRYQVARVRVERKREEIIGRI